MLHNAYFLAKIGAVTAENEQHFAEICQKLATTDGATGFATVYFHGPTGSSEGELYTTGKVSKLT